MKKLILFSALALICASAFSQGFKKAARVEKIGTYKMGNFHLYRYTADTMVVYSLTAKDQKYNIRKFLQVMLGTKEESISFLENAIETMDVMEVGDRFELGLPDDNYGFCTTLLGMKIFGITVGNIGEWICLEKPAAKNMLKDLQAE